jgi:hypothetical protein
MKLKLCLLACTIVLSSCATYQRSCINETVYKKEASDSYWVQDIHTGESPKSFYVQECVAETK